MLDGDVDVGEQAKTLPAVDQEVSGGDGAREEIPGVDDSKGTPGLDDATPGADDEVDGETISGVDGDAPDTANKSDKAKIEQSNVERTSDAIILRRQPRK